MTKPTGVGRGGARPGAGRPPSGRRAYQVRLDPNVVAQLDEHLSGLEEYASRSETIEAAIRAWLGRRR